MRITIWFPTNKNVNNVYWASEIFIFLGAVFEIRTFNLANFSSGKVEELLIKTRDPKISYGFGGHCNLCSLSGLCLFCNSNRMNLSFPDVLDEFLFLYATSFSPKSGSSSHYQTNTHCVEFQTWWIKSVQSWY